MKHHDLGMITSSYSVLSLPSTNILGIQDPPCYHFSSRGGILGVTILFSCSKRKSIQLNLFPVLGWPNDVIKKSPMKVACNWLYGKEETQYIIRWKRMCMLKYQSAQINISLPFQSLCIKSTDMLPCFIWTPWKWASPFPFF